MQLLRDAGTSPERRGCGITASPTKARPLLFVGQMSAVPHAVAERDRRVARAPAARAVAMALLCSVLFAAAVGSMALALATGLQLGRGGLTGFGAVAVDLLLVLQFPIVHSLLLSASGRPWLARLSPFGHGRVLATSTYTLLASCQLLATFWLWSPSGVVWSSPSGAAIARWTLFGLAWVFLQKALWDAGLALQTGAAGWWALLRGRPVNYGDLPTRGLFARCRQPIYFGFAAVLWTAPTWSLDWLALATVWSAYCFFGPRRKEVRWQQVFGARFTAYRATVPYFVPRTFR
jgi:protein-S-isoprenylcysteine O-methyltransferase Ste14